MKHLLKTHPLRTIALACAGLLVFCLLAGSVAQAASIPAWLDDAISVWNDENPATQIRFVEIKDSYVWYMIPKTEQTGNKAVRERTYAIAERHGYQKTEREELITTGRPPSPNKPYRDKKCWSRGFTLDLDVGRQRMLTTLVCDGDSDWFAGFRILE